MLSHVEASVGVSEDSGVDFAVGVSFCRGSNLVRALERKISVMWIYSQHSKDRHIVVDVDRGPP